MITPTAMIPFLRFRVGLAAVFAAAALLFSLHDQTRASATQDPGVRDWPALTRETKPWTRWWWQGSAVDRAVADHTSSRRSAARASAASRSRPSTACAAPRRASSRTCRPSGCACSSTRSREARRLDLGVDMATGTGWPFGGPWVGDDTSPRERSSTRPGRSHGGERLAEPVRLAADAARPGARQPDSRRQRRRARRPAARAAPAQPVLRSGCARARDHRSCRSAGREHEPSGAGARAGEVPARPAAASRLMAYGDSGERVDLTSRVGARRHARLDGAAGRWTLLRAVSRLARQAGRACGARRRRLRHRSLLPQRDSRLSRAVRSRIRRPSSGRAPRVLQRLLRGGRRDRTGGLDAVAPRRVPEAARIRSPAPSAGARRPRQPERRERARARRLPRDDLGPAARHVHGRMARRGRTAGQQLVRNQAHGSPASLLDLYAASDIPETEGTEIPRFKWATSAAHVAGRRARVGRGRDVARRALPLDAGRRPRRRRSLLRGRASTTSSITAPPTRRRASRGRGGCSTRPWSSTPRTRGGTTSARSTATSRACSRSCRAARPDHDVLLYFPFYDSLAVRGNALADALRRRQCARRQGTAFEAAAGLLQRAGFTYDFISDRQLGRHAGQRRPARHERRSVRTASSCCRRPVHPARDVRAGAGARARRRDGPVAQGLAVGRRRAWPGPRRAARAVQASLPPAVQFGPADARRHRGGASGPRPDTARGRRARGCWRARASRASAWSIRGCSSRVARTRRARLLRPQPRRPRGRRLGAARERPRRPSRLRSDGRPAGRARRRAGPPTGTSTCTLQLPPGRSLMVAAASAAPRRASSSTMLPRRRVRRWQSSGPWTCASSRAARRCRPARTIERLASWTTFGEDDVNELLGHGDDTRRRFRGRPGGGGPWRLDLGQVHDSARVRLNGRELATLIGPRRIDIVLDAAHLSATNVARGERHEPRPRTAIADLDRRGVVVEEVLQRQLSGAAPRRTAAPDGLFTAAGVGARWSPDCLDPSRSRRSARFADHRTVGRRPPAASADDGCTPRPAARGLGFLTTARREQRRVTTGWCFRTIECRLGFSLRLHNPSCQQQLDGGDLRVAATGREIRDAHERCFRPGVGRCPAATARCAATPIGRAHPSLGQDELDPARGLPVAGNRAHHRPHLLIPGPHQERRRPSVALHADHEEVGIGLLELLRTVRWNRAAAVHVGIDERRQGSWTLHCRIEVEPDLGQNRPVGSEASGRDNLVYRGQTAVAVARRRDPVRVIATSVRWKLVASSTRRPSSSSRTLEPSFPRSSS